eukprot:scaffold2263_cov391-Prasinococcus_capsulatus_cf.AAC.4
MSSPGTLTLPPQSEPAHPHRSLAQHPSAQEQYSTGSSWIASSSAISALRSLACSLLLALPIRPVQSPSRSSCALPLVGLRLCSTPPSFASVAHCVHPSPVGCSKAP